MIHYIEGIINNLGVHLPTIQWSKDKKIIIFKNK